MAWLPLVCLGATLFAASACDIRTRHVPLWLSVGSLVAGSAVAASQGLSSLEQAALGVLIAALLTLPLGVWGGLGVADMILLAGVGAWESWRLVLWTAWWASLVGAVLALVAWRRRQRVLPYVPAIALGFGLALLA